MDARDALLRVAQRVDHARAEGVHNWIVDRLSDFGTTGLATDNPDVIRHSGESWGRGLGLLGEVIEAIHGHDDGRVAKILSLPAQWLVLALWAMLGPASDTPANWLKAWAPTDDPGVMMRRNAGLARLVSLGTLADRLFREDSVSHRILLDVSRGEGNQQSALWSLVHVSALTGSILYLQEHDAPEELTKELTTTAHLSADLRPEILGEA